MVGSSNQAHTSSRLIRDHNRHKSWIFKWLRHPPAAQEKGALPILFGSIIPQQLSDAKQAELGWGGGIFWFFGQFRGCRVKQRIQLLDEYGSSSLFMTLEDVELEKRNPYSSLPSGSKDRELSPENP